MSASAALGHGKAISRRDFLGRGLKTGLGMALVPSISSLVARQAHAQGAPVCGGAIGGAGRIPFVGFDLAGGANIAGGNVLVGGPGGQLDPLSSAGYVKLGVPTDMQPTDPLFVDSAMGLSWHSDSAMLRGIRLRAQASTIAQTNGVVVCARSENDTQNKPAQPDVRHRQAPARTVSC